jgi:predicted CXXCH cytochrome family protein
VSKSLDPITCERCHGPGEAHALHPSAKNILNPAKLTGPARDSICEQCHLEGTGRVLNPGKDWTDFHPGELAEQTFATYVTLGSDNHDVIPASEVEQLAESHCARASQGKLWCGSCHHPHGVSGPRQEEIKAVCTSCHQKLSPTTHPAGLAECTSCHLPTSATTYVAHAAHTDHRILRNPAKASTAQEGKEKLIAWREPPLPLRQRDLGMGELMLAPSEKYEEMRRHGSDLLLSLAAPGLDHDADAVSSLEAFYFQKGDLEKAVQFGRRSVEVAPQSGMMALNFAIVLDKSGEAEEAERQFLRAIDLDPSLKDAYGRLAMMYVKQSRSQDANNIIDRYLQWNPDEILFHSIKQSPLLNH